MRSLKKASVNRRPVGLQLASTFLRLISPGFRGKTRVARAILKRYLDLQDIEVVDDGGSMFLVPNLREPVAFHLFTDGVYERDTMAFLLSRLSPGATFVDVGANIGVFTIPAARRVGPTGKILALEASSLVFNYLGHNVAINRLSNVRIKRCAVFDHDTPDLPFYEAPVDHFGMGALSPQFNSQPSSVEARTLDGLLAEENITEVDVLKVDVEGFEGSVFRGAERLLNSRRPPIIIFEFCDWAEGRVPDRAVGHAQTLLRSYGYTLWRLGHFGRKGGDALKTELLHGCEMLVAAKP